MPLQSALLQSLLNISEARRSSSEVQKDEKSKKDEKKNSNSKQKVNMLALTNLFQNLCKVSALKTFKKPSPIGNP